MQFVRRCYGLRGVCRFDSKVRFKIESDGRFDSRFDSNAKKTIRRSLLRSVDYWPVTAAKFTTQLCLMLILTITLNTIVKPNPNPTADTN